MLSTLWETKKTENVVHMLRKDDIHRNLNKMQSRALRLVAQMVSVTTSKELKLSMKLHGRGRLKLGFAEYIGVG